jgi:LDH2 family malate/lactate/ureidoglycolate dehydrogenase
LFESQRPVGATICSTDLEIFALRVLETVDVPIDLAAIVAGSLVRADLCGEPTEGIRRLPLYTHALLEGLAQPTLKVRTLVDLGSLIALDCGRSFGPVVAHHVAPLVVERARCHGVSLTTLTNSAHLGRLTDLADLLAEDGIASIIVPNGGGSESSQPVCDGALIIALDPTQVGTQGTVQSALDAFGNYLPATSDRRNEAIETHAYQPRPTPAPAPLVLPATVVEELRSVGDLLGVDVGGLSEAGTTI